MAPVTRAKKSKASGDAPAKAATKAKEVTSTTKRKAADESSPVAPKKHKAVKESQTKQPTTISKNGLLPTKKAAKASKSTKPSKEKVKAQENVEEEPESPVADNDDGDPFSDEDGDEDGDEDEAKALAEAVDSDDEEPAADATNGALFKPGQDVGKAPKPAKGAKQAPKASNGETGVLYVGHIPHGFYEYEMRQYFSQFGTILRLRLSRSKHTGASKHFAFIEFEDAAVAEVVQKTMDNYLLFGHILKCKLVPKTQIHDNLWKGANKRFKKVPRSKLSGNNLKKPLTESGWAKRIENEKQRRSSRAQKLSEMGYEFEAPELKEPTDALQGNAALEGPTEEEPHAVDALLANIAATEEEAAKGDIAVEKPAEDSKQDSPKAKKTKKSSKAKKSKKAKA